MIVYLRYTEKDNISKKESNKLSYIYYHIYIIIYIYRERESERERERERERASKQASNVAYQRGGG